MPQFSSLSLYYAVLSDFTPNDVCLTWDLDTPAIHLDQLVAPRRSWHHCALVSKRYGACQQFIRHISVLRSLKLSSSTFVFTRVCSCCICWTGHKVWWPQRLVLTWTALWDVCRRFANDDIKIFYKECGDLRCKRNQVSFSCVLKPNRVTFMLQACDFIMLKKYSRWLGMVFTERGMLILCLHLRHLIIKSTSQVYQMFLHGVSACWYRAL